MFVLFKRGIEKGISIEIWSTCLEERIPKIFFFDDYRIMKGRVVLAEIERSQDEGIKTLNDLLDLAGITPRELQNDADYEHHKSKS